MVWIFTRFCHTVDFLLTVSRKLHEPANSVAASRNQVDSGLSVKPKKKLNESAQVDVKVRCPCGNSMANGPMIKVCDCLFLHYLQ